MDTLPPLYRDQREIDARHIKLLAIFHFVGAGLSALKMLFLILHFSMMSFVFSEPEIFGQNKGPHPPKELIVMMSGVYVLIGIFTLISLALEAISGYFLWHRKHRMFSMAVAIFNCLSFPLGTVLGVFTLIVLMRNTVIELYEGS